MELPETVAKTTDSYLALADDALPGLVTGLYLSGSLGFGEFHSRSDIDFTAVLARRTTPAEDTRLAAALAELHRRHPAPVFDGHHVTAADLAAPSGECPEVPCLVEWEFQHGTSGIGPVTWTELARHGVAVRGPELTERQVHTDDAELRAFTHANLGSYWQPLIGRLRENTDKLAADPARADYAVQWCVLGTARLHHMLGTGTLTSKSGAGRYALTAFDPTWHPVITEALRIREDDPTPVTRYAGDPLARLRETVEFCTWVIEDGRARGA